MKVGKQEKGCCHRRHTVDLRRIHKANVSPPSCSGTDLDPAPLPNGQAEKALMRESTVHFRFHINLPLVSKRVLIFICDKLQGNDSLPFLER